MNAKEIIKNIEAEQLKAEVPEFNVGDTVRVHAKIKEGNRERIQVFEGTVLKKQGGSMWRKWKLSAEVRCVARN